MIPFSLPAFIKFLVGVFLLQGATALLVLTLQDTDLHRSGWLVVALGLLIGVIAALWFSAISSHASQHTFARASEKFNGSVTTCGGRRKKRKQKRSRTVTGSCCVKPGVCRTARR